MKWRIRYFSYNYLTKNVNINIVSGKYVKIGKSQEY